MRYLAPLLALLLVAASAAAEPGEEAAAVANETLAEGQSTLDKALGGLKDAGGRVGDAVEGTGDGLGKAASGLGRLVGRAAQALAAGAGAAAGALSAAALQLADGTAAAVAALGGAATDAFAVVGTTVPGAVDGLMDGLGAALAAVATAMADMLLAYYGAVFGLRPDAMPQPAFTAIVAAGSAAGGGVAAWSVGSLLRRLGILGSLAGLGGFSRIADDEVLRNPLRAQVFQVIQQHPGIHASELARQVGAGWGTIVHHLDRLEKAKLVAVRKVNNQKCFFEVGGKVSRLDMEVASALRGGTAAQIAGFVAAHPMTSQKSLAQAIGISPALASFHVKKLTSLGALDKVRRGKETVLTATDTMRRVLSSEPIGGSAPAAMGIPA